MPSSPVLCNSQDDEEQCLVKALIDNGAVRLDQLLRLQAKGWKDKSIERHFRNERQPAKKAYESVIKAARFDRMKDMIREIDEGLKFVPTFKNMKFLDLCCGPGGFSSYILGKNNSARGFGVSLPVTDGGQEFSLEDHHKSRFRLFQSDLTRYQLGPSIISGQSLQTLPAALNKQSFDLAILDGYQLRTQASESSLDNDRMIVSQIIIALQAMKIGGVMLVRLPLPHKPLSAKIIYLLAILSEKVQRWKPKSVHANRGVFYAIARGVGKGKQRARMSTIIEGFKELWVRLTFGGAGGLSRCMIPADLDFLITTDDLVRHQLKWLATLGRPLWKVQRIGMRALFIRSGVVF